MGSRRQFGSLVPHWLPPPPGTGRSHSARRDTSSGTVRDLNRTELPPPTASDGGSSCTHVSRQTCLPPALITVLQPRRANSTTIATAGHSSIQPDSCCVANISRPSIFPNICQSVGPFKRSKISRHSRANYRLRVILSVARETVATANQCFQDARTRCRKRIF
jgi:hypothetical protein